VGDEKLIKPMDPVLDAVHMDAAWQCDEMYDSDAGCRHHYCSNLFRVHNPVVHYTERSTASEELCPKTLLLGLW